MTKRPSNSPENCPRRALPLPTIQPLSTPPAVNRTVPQHKGQTLLKLVQPPPLHPDPSHLPQPPVSGMQLLLRYMSKALSNPGRVAGRQPAAHRVGPGQRCCSELMTRLEDASLCPDQPCCLSNNYACLWASTASPSWDKLPAALTWPPAYAKLNRLTGF